VAVAPHTAADNAAAARPAALQHSGAAACLTRARAQRRGVLRRPPRPLLQGRRHAQSGPATPCAPGRGSPGAWRARPARCCMPSGGSPGRTGSPATPARPPRPWAASAACSRAARCGTGLACAPPPRVLRTTEGPSAGGGMCRERLSVPSASRLEPVMAALLLLACVLHLQ